MALPSFSSVFLHQEDISVINEEKYFSQLDEFDISSLDLVYAEHNCGDPVDYILVEIFQLIINLLLLPPNYWNLFIVRVGEQRELKDVN